MYNKNLGWERFTNGELYYMISAVVGCGGLGSSLIEEEELYISYPEIWSSDGIAHQIKFVFISTFPAMEGNNELPITYVSLGKLDLLWDEIEIYVANCPLDEIKDREVTSYVQELILAKGKSRHFFTPFKYYNVFNNIYSNSLDRQNNHLFILNHASPLPDRFRKMFQFDEELKEFNGDYFLITEPCEEVYHNKTFNFEVLDNSNEEYTDSYQQYKVNITEELVTSSTFSHLTK